jgi:phosphatidylinositol kinase/protein kinase (PI-3  family)
VLPVRRLTQELLASVGKEHPQALVYSLTVASKSQSASRLAAARSIMDKMRKHSATLVDQALMVSQGRNQKKKKREKKEKKRKRKRKRKERKKISTATFSHSSIFT